LAVPPGEAEADSRTSTLPDAGAVKVTAAFVASTSASVALDVVSSPDVFTS
jgi:hypothetical protein